MSKPRPVLGNSKLHVSICTLESIQRLYHNTTTYTHGMHGSWSLDSREAAVVVFLLNWALHVVLANLDALADLVQNTFDSI
jgi:hypothetical protein